MTRDEDDYVRFPSRFEIGERVLLKIQGGENDGIEITAYIRTVTFTSSKVRYALLILNTDPGDALEISPGMGSTLHNVDSAMVHTHPGPRTVLAIAFDNYS